MLSYRHLFHAGNHGDVLKHITLIATTRHLMRKPTPLLMVDTHAGAGGYDLGDARIKPDGEAQAGFLRLETWRSARSPAARLPDALADYLDLVKTFHSERAADPAWFYPGSPLIFHCLMDAPGRRAVHDRLKLFELHPTVVRLLSERVAPLHAGRRVAVARADGFAALARLLPPQSGPSGTRRALVLMDPPYEVKTDYATVAAAIEGALRRCATGVYLVWYPVIARAEAHALPRRLRALAQGARRDWLQASLDVGIAPAAPMPAPGATSQRPGLSASGMFVINPPYVLADALRAALPVVAQVLARGPGARWSVEVSA